jgi:hypothetical protein
MENVPMSPEVAAQETWEQVTSLTDGLPDRFVLDYLRRLGAMVEEYLAFMAAD